MNTNDPSREEMADGLLDEAELLIWAMLDDNISEADIKALEALMQEHDEVRSRFLECTQLHADLTLHYKQGEGTAEFQTNDSPVLGSLDMDMPLGTDSRPWPPVAE